MLLITSTSSKQSSFMPALNCVPPSDKWSGKQRWISWAYFPKVVRTNVIVRPVIIATSSTSLFEQVWHKIFLGDSVRQSALAQKIQLGSPDCFSSWEAGVWGWDKKKSTYKPRQLYIHAFQILQLRFNPNPQVVTITQTGLYHCLQSGLVHSRLEC